MRRELSATVSGRDHAIEVTALDGGRFRVVIDGRVREVDAVEVRPGTWSLVCDGGSLVVDLDRDGGKLQLSGAAGTSVAVVEDARRRRLAQATSAGRPKVAGEEIRAPIAGRVVKLLVAVDDVVGVDQGVVVLEAMKMENEIKAERGGRVTAIKVQPGQSVDTRELLLVLA